MRSVLVIALVSAGLGLGHAVAADTLPDLPGMGVAEAVTGGATAPTEDATSVKVNSTSDDRVPAPDPTDSSTQDVSDAVTNTVSPEDTAVIVELPGGTAIPLLSDVAPVADSAAGIATLVMLALAVVVLWTRFLVRLNHI
ncbi:MAG: hypothetical protein WD826_10270 [Actinomycetota bacterium]